jgi:hypothetical protein
VRSEDRGEIRESGDESGDESGGEKKEASEGVVENPYIVRNIHFHFSCFLLCAFRPTEARMQEQKLEK